MNGTEADIPTDEWHGAYEGGWQGLIVPEAFAHPAKFSYSLAERMFGHAYAKEWVKKGDVVADPFGGVGCGGIVAAYCDLQWIGCELEQKFVDLAEQNFELHRRKWEKLNSPMPQIIQGDSRKLAAKIGTVECVVSSPPYEGSVLNQMGDKEKRATRMKEQRKSQGEIAHTLSCAMDQDYGQTEGQLGAMKPGSVDAVVSSPPYSEGLGHGGTPTRGEGRTDDTNLDAMQGGYGNTPGNLGNLRHGCLKQVACVVSSPPYEGSNDHERPLDSTRAKNNRHRIHLPYGDSAGNIGNDSGPTFWQAAKEIVHQSYQILKPGGHAIWVVKAFVRKGKIVDFPGDWRRLCESVGFKTVCVHHAMLVKETNHDGLFGDIKEKKERKSFFRRLAESKGSPAIDYEVVLCMERGRHGPDGPV
jgi:hypothetical protein